MVIVQAVIQAQNQIANPFFPQYLEQNGVHPISSVEYWAGAILAASPLTSALFAPIWGGIGDRIGRKKMVLRSSIATSLTFIFMGFCTTPWQMLGLRAFSGVFSGFSTSAMSLVATQVPESRLGFALGWLSTGQITGALIGPLLGGLLADHLPSYRDVFYYGGTATMLIAVMSVMNVREEFRKSDLPDRNKPPMLKQLREIVKHPDLAPMFVVIMLAQICSIGVSPVLPIFVRSLVSDSPWQTTITGAALAVTGVAGLLGAPFLGRRSDEIGHRRVLLLSLAGTALFTLPQMFAREIFVFVGLRFGVGIFLGGILPSANAMIGRIAQPEARGQVYGFTSTAQFLGRAVGPLLGASVAAAFGIPTVFALIGTLMAANFLWVWLNVRPSIKPS